MIKYTTGNLLKADVEALVNPVNTVGVMGAGLALQFRKTYPEMFTRYEKACNSKEMKIGQMCVHAYFSPECFQGYIINFPTKKDWRNPSKIEYIEEGLQSLTEVIKELEIKSIAIPALGCGNGGLDWSQVRPLIEKAFSDLPDVDVLIFEPMEKEDE